MGPSNHDTPRAVVVISATRALMQEPPASRLYAHRHMERRTALKTRTIARKQERPWRVIDFRAREGSGPGQLDNGKSSFGDPDRAAKREENGLAAVVAALISAMPRQLLFAGHSGTSLALGDRGARVRAAGPARKQWRSPRGRNRRALDAAKSRHVPVSAFSISSSPPVEQWAPVIR